MNGDQLRDEWFHSPSGSSSPPERQSTLPPVRRVGDPAWSTVTGAINGLIGATVVLVLMRRIDPLAQPGIGAITAVAGALLGGLFGRVTRRLLRVIPRIAVGAIFASALWLALYAFVIMAFAPEWATSVPFESSIVDALVFGACLGLVPPVRVRSERGRRA